MVGTGVIGCVCICVRACVVLFCLWLSAAVSCYADCSESEYACQLTSAQVNSVEGVFRMLGVVHSYAGHERVRKVHRRPEAGWSVHPSPVDSQDDHHTGWVELDLSWIFLVHEMGLLVLHTSLSSHILRDK